MNMIKNMLGQIIDIGQEVKDAIQEILISVAKELGCKHEEFFIMIQPGDEEYNFKVFVYKLEQNGPVRIREITTEEIKKILSDDE